MSRFAPHRPLLLAAALGLLLLAVAGTAVGRTESEVVPAQPSEGCSPQALPAGDHLVHIDVDGVDREALVHVPRIVRGHAVPLLLAFHGAGGSGRRMATYSGFSGVADLAGFVVAYPSAARPRGVWTLAARESETAPDDLAFTRRLLDLLESRVCVDARRVSAAGVSNGGGFVARLGCELSDRLAGIVVVAGGFSALAPCAPARPLSVLEIHGTDDPVVPYAGRAGAGSVPAWLRDWLLVYRFNQLIACIAGRVRFAPNRSGFWRSKQRNRDMRN